MGRKEVILLLREIRNSCNRTEIVSVLNVQPSPTQANSAPSSTLKYSAVLFRRKSPEIPKIFLFSPNLFLKTGIL